MMQFEQPGALWFLGLIIIPIFIHLYQFHKTRILYFPGVYRLKQQLQTARKQKQIQHWLVLLLRVLAIIFLVLAFSMPSCNPKAKQGLGRYIFVLDNSLSMKRKSTEGELFEQAKNQMRSVLQQLGNDAEVMLITQSDLYQNSWRKASEISLSLDTINCFDQYSGVQDWANQIRRLMENNAWGNSTKVFVFTDGESSAWQNVNQLGNLKNQLQDWQFVVFKANEIKNISIDTAWADETTMASDGATMIQVKLKNHGATILKTVLKAHTVMGNLVLSSPEKPSWEQTSKQLLLAQEVELKAGEEKLVSVKWPVKQQDDEWNALDNSKSKLVKSAGFSKAKSQVGWLKLEIGADDFIYDNTLLLHPLRNWKWKLGLLGENQQIRRMFSVQEKVELFTLQLPLKKEQLDKLSSICIVGNGGFSEADKDVLNAFIAEGGTVLQLPVSTMKIQSPMGTIEGKWEEKEVELDIAGFKHPVLRGVFDALPIDKTDVPIFKNRFQISDENVSDVLQSVDGWPLLIEKNLDQGKYYLWLSDLTKGSANWLQSSWSLPVFTHLLVGNSMVFKPLYGSLMSKQIMPLPVDMRFQEAGLPLMMLSSESLGYGLGLKNASNVVAMLEYQKMAGGTGGVLLGENPKLAGMYSVKTNDNWNLMALNHHRQESSMITYELIKEFPVTDSARGGSVLAASEQSQIWRWMLMAALMCFIIEMIFLGKNNRNQILSKN